MDIKEVKKSQIFIPEFNGNKDLPDAEQIKITISEFPAVIDAKSIKSFKTDAKGDISVSYNDAMLIARCVGSISGLTVGGKAIENGNDLMSSKSIALEGLITEIRGYLLDDGDVLSSGESKA